ncbi:hypothetical protein Tco_1397978 [Tanacetum coccineum]
MSGGGIRPIVVGRVWRHLVSKVGAIMISHSLDGLQFGVGVSGGGEAILHAVNRLIEGRRDDVGLSMLLVDFKNALVDRELDYIKGNIPYGHAKGCIRAWYLDDGTIVGVTLVVEKVLKLIIEDGPRCGLHLNVDKNELLGGPASVDFDFSSVLVIKGVAKTIELMNAIAKINDPQCELLLLHACTGISKLHFAMRTCPPRVFESAQRSFNVALCFALERNVLNYAFLASRMQSVGFQTKLLRLTGIVAFGPTLDDALCVFNTSIEINILEDIYFTQGGSDFWFGTDYERELDKDTMVSLKRIRKFYVTKDIGARAHVHIYSRISFAIARDAKTEIVS